MARRCEAVGGTKTSKSLQNIADELGVKYYSGFEVFEIPASRVRILLSGRAAYLPMAEVYEKGRWRMVVIGGRPYFSESAANSVISEAREAQECFLKAFASAQTMQGSSWSSLSNPIDHWKYQLEL